MKLHDFLLNVSVIQISGPATPEITTLAYDSRAVRPGSLFVAIPGTHVDGHDFIPKAIGQGATAVVYDNPARWQDHDGVAGILVPSARVALAPLAAAFYGHPGESMRVVGITGTDGKTTTTWLTSVVLEAGGHSTGLMGTVDFKVGERVWANDTRQSTPEAPEVQALLRDMVTAGCDHAVIEATSHALSARWNRLGGCAFDVAVLTNVTHEHLDYHGSVEQYRRDKARLFEMLGESSRQSAVGSRRLATGNCQLPTGDKQSKIAIVNADDPNHQMFLDAAPAHAQRLRYAVNSQADVRAHDVHSTRDGLQFRVTSPWGEAQARLKLTGDFNVWNVLAALTVAGAEGVPLDVAVRALEQVPGVRGRMERIEQGQPFTVLVDYAHTPGAFEKLMRIVRPLTDGQLIAVFGSAGERDREKRPVQGEIAAQFCDFLVITDEDPRREDSMAIINEIAAGVERAMTNGTARIRTDVPAAGRDVPPERLYMRIPDRAQAICAAFAHARPGDIVLLLGKGHEGSIIYADHSLPWNEAEEARRALREMGFVGEQVSG